MDRVLEFLETLVSIDTVSDKSNLTLINFCRETLDSFGIPAEIIASPSGDKANLFATIGPALPGGIILSGHSDVVPVEGQQWRSPPFSMRVADGRAFGRGTADMKGFIACVLAAIPAFVRAPLARPVHLAITFDEEIGCKGAPSLIEWLTDRMPRPQAVFVGEPTDMNVVNAHKGLLAIRTECHGIEAHSGLPHLGLSAVTMAMRAMSLLDSLARETSTAIDDRFTPDRTTVSFNRISGGTATNILAGQCWFDWDIRTIPTDDAQKLLKHLIAEMHDTVFSAAHLAHPGVRIESTVLANVPGLTPEPDGFAESCAHGLAGNRHARTVSYVTEAGLYQKAGYSTVVVGPGSIKEAHRADEFVSLDQLHQCRDFLARLRDILCAA